MHRDTIKYLIRAFDHANRDLDSGILELQDEIVNEIVAMAGKESLDDLSADDLISYMREWFRVDEVDQLNLPELESLVSVLDEVEVHSGLHPLAEGLASARLDLTEDFRELRDDAVSAIVDRVQGAYMKPLISDAFGELESEEKYALLADMYEQMSEGAFNALSPSPDTLDDVYAAAFDKCEAFIITHPQSQNPTLRLTSWDTGEREPNYPRAESVKKALAEAEKAAQQRGAYLQFPRTKPSMSR